MQVPFKCLFLLPFLLILLAGCSKNATEPEPDADYNGTWILNHPIPAETGFTNLNREIELNNLSYTEIWRTHDATSNVYRCNVWEGKILRSGNILQFKVTKMKVYNYDPSTSTGELLDLVSETVPTEPHIDAYLTLSWETASYTLQDGKLIFYIDWNDDGDYADTDEFLVYSPAI